ncbi:MAG: hypothetical protein ABFD69_02960 [Candidatus Sumerlaeia bacterium]
MACFIDIFSPETYEAFVNSPRDLTGFRLRHKKMAEKIQPGNIFVCYITKLSRWCGLYEVCDGPFIDKTPRFQRENDPYVVRFHIRQKVWLEIDKSIPIHDDSIWSGLSFTRELDKNSIAWTGKFRSSLTRLNEKDGAFLCNTLTSQASALKTYPLSEQDQKKLATHTVNRADKTVTVSVPENGESSEIEEIVPETENRESIRIQALIARIGSQMGLSIWIPASDRGRVLKEWKNDGNHLIERLPLNYDETTLRTIENIDVLWLRGRSIVRAFEVEHTTSIYSGILRMADLLALQPNMAIKLHIVAPDSKREKVFQEIRRPVFSLLERGPLAETCTYISYDSLHELGNQKHLQHLSDSVLDEYAEEAE